MLQIVQFFLCLNKINLIKDPERRDIRNTKFSKHFPSCIYMFVKTLMRYINNVDNEIGISNFIESAFE